MAVVSTMRRATVGLGMLLQLISHCLSSNSRLFYGYVDWITAVLIHTGEEDYVHLANLFGNRFSCCAKVFPCDK